MSTFLDLRCCCGGLFNCEIFPLSDIHYDGFVRKSATFVICDDLHVMPSDFGKTLVMLRHIGLEDIDSIEEYTVKVTMETVCLSAV